MATDDVATWCDGRRRTYRLHVPSDPGPDAPLVVAMHYGQADARSMEDLTGIVDPATDAGFVVALPEAADGRGYWDDGRFGDVDDVAFVDHLVYDVRERVSLPLEHVNLLGFSSGATMALVAATRLRPAVSAVAAVAGTIGCTVADAAEPGPPVPLVYFHGTHDPFAYYYTGGSAGTRRGVSLPAEELGRWWSVRNGGPAEPAIEELAPTVDDGTRVVRHAYRGGPRDADVVAHMIVGGGHTWPGGGRWSEERIVGRTTRQIDATAVACRFFLDHGRSLTGGRRAR